MRTPIYKAPDTVALDAFDPHVSPLDCAHQVEREVRRQLLAHPDLRFASLVVRRMENGVCLQGVLEADENSPDVCGLAQRVAGVEQVINQLVLAPTARLPRKG